MVDRNKHSAHNGMLSTSNQADTLPPKPKQDSDVGLFLLEVLVDKIKFFARLRYDEDNKTCVKLSLPDHPSVEPLVIREEESAPAQSSVSHDSTKYFNVGKSVLFVLQKHEISTAMNKFNIETTVYDTFANQPAKICNILGQARINLTKEFVKARQKYLADPTSVSCEVLQDKFTLVGSDNSNTGEICMYLRISCFGKLIVTRFQGKGGQLSTLGAGTAGMSGSRGPDRPHSPNNPCECSLCTTTGSAPAPARAAARAVHSDASQDSPGSFDERCYCSKPKSQNVAHRNIEGYCMQVPPVTSQRTQISDELTDTQKEQLNATCKKLVEPMYPEAQFTVQNVSTDVKNPSSKPNYNAMPCQKHKDPEHKSHATRSEAPSVACRNTEGYCLHVPQGRTKKYEEIGTTLTGNELKIKVPASSAIIKRISQTHCAIQKPYDKDNKGKDKQTAGAPCDPPCGRNQISLALPCEATCCAGNPPADTQFTCTTEGCTQIGKHAATAGFVRSDPKDPKPEKEIIPNKDVYVFKVAKTSLEGDRKCKLELEFTAPKAGNKRLPVQKQNATLQSDACECCRRRCR